jgi:hypothetical protein
MRILLATLCCVVFATVTQAQSYVHDFIVPGISGTHWVDTGLDLLPNTVLHFSATGQVDVGSGWGVHGPAGEPSMRFAPGTSYPATPPATRPYGLLARVTASRTSSEDGDTWSYSDSGLYFVTQSGGHLWLTVNDDYAADNSGAFKVHVEQSTFPVVSQVFCHPCPGDIPTRAEIRGEFPDPKVMQALLVFDGQITSISQSGETTVVFVSQGSALAKYGDLPNLKVVYEKSPTRPDLSIGKGVTQGVVFQNKKVSLITGTARLKR